MPIVISYDDPRLIASTAAGASQYRQGQDAWQQNFAQSQDDWNRRVQSDQIGMQVAALNERTRASRLAQDLQERAFDASLEQRDFQNDLSLQDRDFRERQLAEQQDWRRQQPQIQMQQAEYEKQLQQQNALGQQENKQKLQDQQLQRQLKQLEELRSSGRIGEEEYKATSNRLRFGSGYSDVLRDQRAQDAEAGRNQRAAASQVEDAIKEYNRQLEKIILENRMDKNQAQRFIDQLKVKYDPETLKESFGKELSDKELIAQEARRNIEEARQNLKQVSPAGPTTRPAATQPASDAPAAIPVDAKTGLPIVSSQADFNALPSGSMYLNARSGRVFIKQ